MTHFYSSVPPVAKKFKKEKRRQENDNSTLALRQLLTLRFRNPSDRCSKLQFQLLNGLSLACERRLAQGGESKCRRCLGDDLCSEAANRP